MSRGQKSKPRVRTALAGRVATKRGRAVWGKDGLLDPAALEQAAGIFRSSPLEVEGNFGESLEDSSMIFLVCTWYTYTYIDRYA